uniref:Uncharacterized protein n=1 Tax=Apteryx owenii TaxID=8824 RepID=A0A8B9S9U6_APTOW
MAEHSPLLDTTPIISSEIPLLTSPIVSGDGAQQVILVQVNPGEAFTIRREDGQFQCITGPAQVPMMSPNGSVPTIYVPPGYAPQVIEDNGVRRVVVVPQAPEFHPGGHAVIHRPPHPPLPGFLPLPAMIPPPPRHIYSPVTGAGDMATQYIPQYHTSQVYGDMGKYCCVRGCDPDRPSDSRCGSPGLRLQGVLGASPGGLGWQSALLQEVCCCWRAVSSGKGVTGGGQ